MKERLSFVLAAVFASVLSACGGGGGAGSTPATAPPTTTPQGTGTSACTSVSTAARKIAAVGVAPLTAGSSFAYCGSLSQTTVRSLPSPEPTVTASALVTMSVQVTSSPGAAAGTFDQHSVEQDAFATNTTQTTTDAMVTAVNGVLYESSEVSTDLNNDVTATTYTAPYLAYAWASPAASGTSLSNTPPSEVKQSLTDGSVFDRLYSGTVGAYSETDTVPGVTSPSTITVNADASATYTLNGLAPSGAPQTTPITFSAPTAGSINATINGKSYQFADWIPSGPLYSDTTVDRGAPSSSMPCTVSYTGTLDESQRTLHVVDPALGTVETRTTTSYNVANYNNSGTTVGPVCVTISDVEQLYYDYLLDTQYAVYVAGNGQPFQTVTLSETYGLSASPALAVARRASSTSAAQSASAGLSSVVAAREAALTMSHAVERAKRTETLVKAIQSLRSTSATATIRQGGVIR